MSKRELVEVEEIEEEEQEPDWCYVAEDDLYCQVYAVNGKTGEPIDHCSCYYNLRRQIFGLTRDEALDVVYQQAKDLGYIVCEKDGCPIRFF